MSDLDYKKSFDLFLKNTDEKKVLVRFIRSNGLLGKTKDFLDIGSGNGSLAVPISEQVKTTTIIEPNVEFIKKLNVKKYKVLKKRWENVELMKKFDFILAAYVVTYFHPADRQSLIEKAYSYLKPGGKLLIISIDSNRGSWRGIHSYFYKLMGLRHKSSDIALKKILKKYRPEKFSLVTKVYAKDMDEMMEILKFDFGKYSKQFKKYAINIKKYLGRYCFNNGHFTLLMFHNAFIITKK